MIASVWKNGGWDLGSYFRENNKDANFIIRSGYSICNRFLQFGSPVNPSIRPLLTSSNVVKFRLMVLGSTDRFVVCDYRSSADRRRKRWAVAGLKMTEEIQNWPHVGLEKFVGFLPSLNGLSRILAS